MSIGVPARVGAPTRRSPSRPVGEFVERRKPRRAWRYRATRPDARSAIVIVGIANSNEAVKPRGTIRPVEGVMPRRSPASECLPPTSGQAGLPQSSGAGKEPTRQAASGEREKSYTHRDREIMAPYV